MSKLRVESFTISLDGFSADPDQDMSHPPAAHGRRSDFSLRDGRPGHRSWVERAREAAGDKDVQVGGGVNVTEPALRQRMIDEMQIAISPALLGSGERFFNWRQPSCVWLRLHSD